jgi:hypothetical protein
MEELPSLPSSPPPNFNPNDLPHLPLPPPELFTVAHGSSIRGCWNQETKLFLRTFFPSIFFAMLAGCCNSVMDTLAYHFATSKFSQFDDQQFWNPELSWTNKWKNGDPAQGEKFFGSSTFLVSLTDGWHLFKSLMITFWLFMTLSWGHQHARFTRIQPKRSMYIYFVVTFFVLRFFFSGTFEFFWQHVWLLPQ